MTGITDWTVSRGEKVIIDILKKDDIGLVSLKNEMRCILERRERREVLLDDFRVRVARCTDKNNSWKQ